MEFSTTEKFSTIIKSLTLTTFDEAMDKEFNIEQNDTSQYVHLVAAELLLRALLTMTPEEQAYLIQQGTTPTPLSTIGSTSLAFLFASISSTTTTSILVLSSLPRPPLVSANIHRPWYGVTFPVPTPSSENNMGCLPALSFSNYILDRLHGIPARFQQWQTHTQR